MLLEERGDPPSLTTLMRPWLLPAMLLAATVPTLLALHQPPSVTLLNQCLAVALWGGVAMVLAPARVPRATALGGRSVTSIAIMSIEMRPTIGQRLPLIKTCAGPFPALDESARGTPSL